MGRKKKPEPDDKEQSVRFIETVERIGLVEKPEEAFKEAFHKIAKPKRKQNDKGDPIPKE
jgi:hypothetical protein